MSGPLPYTRPADWLALSEARDAGSAYLAGGTELMPLMRAGLAHPANIIDLERVVDGGIELREDSLVIGAMTRLQDAAHDPRVIDAAPAVAQALQATASAQVRNLATIGGNLLQRTRCGYFRDRAFPCNKRIAGTGCPAMGADDRHAALLGTSPYCAATHASDLAVALTALNASVQIRNLDKGIRSVPIDQLYAQPHRPEVDTTLADGEIILSVQIPRNARTARSAFSKLRERASFDFALVSTAAALELTDGRISAVRIAMGGIATIPWRPRNVEQRLIGRAPTSEAMHPAFEGLVHGARVSQNGGYRLDLAHQLTVRVLVMLAQAS